MDGENLIRMANRIGDFFAAMPDRNESVEGIAQHVARYWEPRMRRQLLGMITDGRADALTPLVAEAFRTHREVFLPAGDDSLPVPPTGQSEA